MAESEEIAFSMTADELRAVLAVMQMIVDDEIDFAMEASGDSEEAYFSGVDKLRRALDRVRA